MSRTQLSNLGKFTVGREGIGKIEFFNVDLTSVDIDNIFDDRDMEERYEEKHGGKSIVQLKVRSATVYPKDATKPPRGQGLNVPSRIYLENSWPRSHGGRKAVLAKSGPAFDKHVNRFKSIKGTKFVDYVADTGVWIFEVDHFTTYGLDEDGESLYTEEGEDMDGVQQDSSGLSEPPPDDTMQSIETVTNTGDVDDTFEFKLNRSKSSLRSSHIPGEFDKAQDMTVSYDYDDPSADESVEEDTMMSGGLDRDDVFSTLPGVIQASSHGAHERPNSSTALESPGADDIAEDTQVQELPGSFNFEEPKMLRSILKPTAAASLFTIASPEKLAKDSWEEQLQRTMSPKKRDRQALRDLQQSALRHEREGAVESPFKRSMLGQSMLGQSYLAQKSAKKVGFGASTFGGNNLGPGKSEAFRTSMDLMNSLWAQEKTSTRSTVAKGFEVC
jgi:nuclear pore complex protein Nup98-Nup96